MSTLVRRSLIAVALVVAAVLLVFIFGIYLTSIGLEHRNGQGLVRGAPGFVPA